MAGELLFVSGGLGQLLTTGRELMDVPQVMAVMVAIVAVGSASTACSSRRSRCACAAAGA